ncbi:MAG: hypothetical protein RR050_02960 [Bacilli bacterium]
MKKTTIFRLIITLLITMLLYYVMLPAINLSSSVFWLFLILVIIIYYMTSIIALRELPQTIIRKFNNPNELKKGLLVLIIPGIFLLITLINFINSPFFTAKSYHNRITINEDGKFNEGIKNVDFNMLPLLDKFSSQKLGDRVMGQMPELVSQFYVSDLYTQINYNNDIIRVTPLEYNGFFKWFANKKDGVKGYITVNSVTGESKLVKLDKGMKYMPSAYLNDNLYRHLRFNYPTEIFGKENFEIDNDGNPYWIIPTLKYTGVGLKEEVTGIIMLNPITGDSKKYTVKDVPKWVDHVYPADLIISQVNDWGKYVNGYFNAIFGQKDVVKTTRGYNYLAQNDDIYLYTGITSAASDESNLGFILTNLRTKETIFYAVAGAEEYSAMASAEGQVQQMKYVASFPLLINLNSKPTYLMSLKDNAGLVKMYAFVDVVDYQKVVVTDSSKGIEEAANNYLGNSIYDENVLETKEIKIESIKTTLIDGNTYYYIISEENDKFRISIKINENILPFINIGDKFKVTYQKGEVNNITKINK